MRGIMAGVKIERMRPYLTAVWDILSIGVMGISSFVTLFVRNQELTAMAHLIMLALIAYILLLTAEFLFLRILKKDRNWRETLRFTRKVFRLIYTAIYLTIIAANLCGTVGLAAAGDATGVLIQNVITFIGVALIGTSCLWKDKALMRFVEYIEPGKIAGGNTALNQLCRQILNLTNIEIRKC